MRFGLVTRSADMTSESQGSIHSHFTQPPAQQELNGLAYRNPTPNLFASIFVPSAPSLFFFFFINEVDSVDHPLTHFLSVLNCFEIKQKQIFILFQIACKLTSTRCILM
jgi:hypothetical protein